MVTMLWNRFKVMIPFAIYNVIYSAIFVLMRQRQVDLYYHPYLEIDQQLPFVSVFAVPYLIWFLWIGFICFYTAWTDVKLYLNVSLMLMIGSTIYLIISCLWPTELSLRPTILDGDDVFCRLTSYIYGLSPETYVFPSLHIFDTCVTMYAVCHGRDKLFQNRCFKVFASLLAVLICLSTVLIKQHSVIDVAGGFVMFFLLLPVVSKCAKIAPFRSDKGNRTGTAESSFPKAMAEKAKEKSRHIACRMKRMLKYVKNPHVLLCFGIAWMITNGWSYVFLLLGTWFGNKWLIGIATAYLTFLWFPFTPEKIVTVGLALSMIRLFYPDDAESLKSLIHLRNRIRKKDAPQSAESDRDQRLEGIRIKAGNYVLSLCFFAVVFLIIALILTGGVTESGIKVLLKLFVCLMIYSFVGWIWESTFCSLHRFGRLTNRGYLIGPVCPIYGWGAVAVSLAFYGEKSLLLIFLLGGTLCCSLEYTTSYVMEKAFHQRWWDYSNKKFNVQGRVYLLGYLFFGLCSVLIVRAIQPLIFGALTSLNDSVLRWIAFSLLAVHLCDHVIVMTRRPQQTAGTQSAALYLPPGKATVQPAYAYPTDLITIFQIASDDSTAEMIIQTAGTLSRTGRFEETKKYKQHGGTSVYAHCGNVAYLSVRMAEKLPVQTDTQSLIRGALLHDYFLYDWHVREAGRPLHGFYHPKVALKNAVQDYSDLNQTEADIISRHMFPLTWGPPKTAEGWIVCTADKICAVGEIFHALCQKMKGAKR